jgi:hypothetical protein
MRTWCHYLAAVGLCVVAVLLSGCSGGKSGPVTVRVWAAENRQVHVAIPGGGVSVLAEGRQSFSASLEEGFDLKGESVAGEGRAIRVGLEIDAKRPVRLEVSRLTEVKVERDGQPVDPATEFPAGKYKLVIDGKLP